MSGLFGSKSSTTSSTKPYSGDYKNQMSQFYNTLKGNLNSNEPAYSGELTTGLSDTQKSAMGGLSGLINNDAMTDTISGKYLDPSTNPYLSQTYDLAADKVSKSLGTANDNINSQFNNRGLYNSSARRETLQEQADGAGDTLAGLANSIYGTAYNNERTNQMNAINQQGNLINSQFNQGTTEQQNSQSALDAKYKEYLRQQGVDDNDINNMMNYFGLVKSPSSTSSTSSSPGVGTVAMSLMGK